MATASRRGVRRGAIAATFALSLLTYLVLTAVPAFAATTCSLSTIDAANDHLTVNVGTDDRVTLWAADLAVDEYQLSVNGAAFAAMTSCGAAVTATVAATVWVEVLGSDSGGETLTLLHPTGLGAADVSMAAQNITVDLGSGNDSLVFQYGALAAPAVSDPASADYPSLGTSDGGDLIVDVESLLLADGDVRVDDAEAVSLNMGDGNDGLDAGSLFDLTVPAPGTSSPDDDIATVDNPWSVPLTENGGAGDDYLISGASDDVFMGGPGSDRISYRTAPNGVTVDLVAQTGVGMGNDTLSDIQDVDGSDFDDSISGSDLDNDLDGFAGDDTILGLGGRDVLSGGANADIITDGLGADVVNGDAGNDVVNQSATPDGVPAAFGGPTETLSGGAGGSDVLNYGDRTVVTVVREGGLSGIDVNLDGDSADSNEEGDVTGGFEGFITGSANDLLVGDGDDESFRGGLGDDAIAGGAGADWADFATCTAGITADMVAGTVTGCSVDTITGIEGISGTPFADTFIDDVEANNLYVGWDGDDIFDQGPQSTDADGLNDDADLVQGDGGADAVDYGDRTEDIAVDDDGTGSFGGFPLVSNGGVFSADDGAPGESDSVTSVGSFTSGSGDDVFLGDPTSTDPVTVVTDGGDDTVTTGNGDDTIDTGDGDDVANANGGDDSITTGAGDDVANGGDGDDILTLGEGNDAATGGNGEDLFDLGDGNDTASGGNDDDTFLPGAGDDTMFGDAGNDTFSTLGTADGSDIASGGLGWDVYDATGRTDDQNLTSDTVCFQDDGVFGEGDGLCFVEEILGGLGNDFIAGDNANNVLKGSQGNDNIQGLKGRDMIQGGAGDDRLSGGKGPDVLKGGAGFDRGSGGPGADTCTAIEVAKSC